MLRIFWGLALALVLAPVARAEETVTVQLVKSTAQAPYYIAVGKGYFEKEGLKIDAGETRSALDTIAPLAQGRLDASLGAATAGFFNAAHRGFDLRIVAALGIQGPVMATQPLVRKALWDDGTIKSAKDLRGRKVAINAPGDITEYFLTLMLEKYGMTTKDVDLTPLGFGEQIAAFKNGAIDAGFLPEPVATATKLTGSVVLLEPEAGVGEGTITTYVFAGLHFLNDRPKVAQAFLRALVRGARDAQGAYSKNPEIAAMIAREAGIAPAAVEQATPYVIDPNLDITKYEAGLHREEAVLRKNGRLTYDEPLDFTKVIDARPIHEAAASIK
ncbi:MAG TPA: ABC transporter substrate-binding protein [Stellaceae bacterium]|nr:ABC transporter substrate-binding protein [Stellaceae bacterium]